MVGGLRILMVRILFPTNRFAYLDVCDSVTCFLVQDIVWINLDQTRRRRRIKIDIFLWKFVVVVREMRDTNHQIQFNLLSFFTTSFRNEKCTTTAKHHWEEWVKKAYFISSAENRCSTVNEDAANTIWKQHWLQGTQIILLAFSIFGLWASTDSQSTQRGWSHSVPMSCCCFCCSFSYSRKKRS